MIKNSSKLPSFDQIEPAMVRATRRAAEIARQHNQPLLFWRDGKIVRVPVDELPPLPDEDKIQTKK